MRWKTILGALKKLHYRGFIWLEWEKKNFPQASRTRSGVPAVYGVVEEKNGVSFSRSWDEQAIERKRAGAVYGDRR